jgi:hypothetical protein
MSEYQFIEFRAVDRPLNDKQLAFAERQSSRAEVSRRSLKVEYHYSDFRGDIDGLLRNGFDVFLHYANYGVRAIRLRLPDGLPFEKNVWSEFVDDDRLMWSKDPKGKGGILSLCPYHESGELDEVREFDEYVDAAVHVRESLIAGDLRALYLLWLCAADDDYNDPDETIEPPVPHGMAELPRPCENLLTFFGLDTLLLKAAGEGVENAPTRVSQDKILEDWVVSLNAQQAKSLLTRFLVEDSQSVKADMIAKIRAAQSPIAWATTEKKRTFNQLLETCKALRAGENIIRQREAAAKAKREAAKAEKERQARMKEMVASPAKWLKEAEKLADARGTDNYKAAADILADLREAIGGEEGDKITRRQAAHLAKKYPTLNQLKSSLRKRGLLES